MPRGGEEQEEEWGRARCRSGWACRNAGTIKIFRGPSEGGRAAAEYVTVRGGPRRPLGSGPDDKVRSGMPLDGISATFMLPYADHRGGRIMTAGRLVNNRRSESARLASGELETTL
jgi:hypothetical protein